MIRRYEFRTSDIEERSLMLIRITTLKTGEKREAKCGFYRYQGNDGKGNPVYRDVDGNFKPLEELTLIDEVWDFKQSYAEYFLGEVPGKQAEESNIMFKSWNLNAYVLCRYLNIFVHQSVRHCTALIDLIDNAYGRSLVRACRTWTANSFDVVSAGEYEIITGITHTRPTQIINLPSLAFHANWLTRITELEHWVNEQEQEQEQSLPITPKRIRLHHIDKALSEIRACWAITKRKCILPGDEYNNPRLCYHIHPDSSYPDALSIKRFDSYQEIWDWIQEVKQYQQNNND